MAETTAYIVELADGSKRRVTVAADLDMTADLDRYGSGENTGAVTWTRSDGRYSHPVVASIGGVVCVYREGEFVVELLAEG